ncbi:MAG: hypothetical protein LUI12_06315 [Clostridiales bacterium]|nr:hypothetical protein [Clostridiales bacterium]
MSYRIAVASSEGKRIDQHFAKATSFVIYEISGDGKATILEKRSAKIVCHNGEHRDDEFYEKIALLKDCRYILVAKIGQRASMYLKSEGMIAYEYEGDILVAIEKLTRYVSVQDLIYKSMRKG